MARTPKDPNLTRPDADRVTTEPVDTTGATLTENPGDTEALVRMGTIKAVPHGEAKPGDVLLSVIGGSLVADGGDLQAIRDAAGTELPTVSSERIEAANSAAADAARAKADATS